MVQFEHSRPRFREWHQKLDSLSKISLECVEIMRPVKSLDKSFSHPRHGVT